MNEAMRQALERSRAAFEADQDQRTIKAWDPAGAASKSVPFHIEIVRRRVTPDALRDIHARRRDLLNIRTTMAERLADTFTGDSVLQAFMDRQPVTLYGLPVEIDDRMPADTARIVVYSTD